MITTKRILIAEDQETECTALKEILKAEPGWDITVSKDGQEAMDMLCDGFHPDICLLDIRMPKVDGLQMLQRIRRDPLLRSLKVIVTSGTRDKETILALARLNISGYLLKPYNAEKTLAMLRPLLASTGADPSLFTKNLLKHTALAADDDKTALTSLAEIFKSEPNWEFVSTHDGQETLDRLHSGLRPDLLMIDLRMPKVDGFTLIQRIREDPTLRRLRIVVISADPDRDQLKALAQMNISGYILKPFDGQKVKLALQKTIDVIEGRDTDSNDSTPPV